MAEEAIPIRLSISARLLPDDDWMEPMSNAKYEYAKIQRKILLEDALATIFIDSGLLRT